jgi:hypothetical protein
MCSAGHVRPAIAETEIPWFDREKEIILLLAYPRNFHSRDAALESQFIERGRKYWNLCEPSYQEHTSQTLRQPIYSHSAEDRSKKEFSASTVCNSISE